MIQALVIHERRYDATLAIKLCGGRDPNATCDVARYAAMIEARDIAVDKRFALRESKLYVPVIAVPNFFGGEFVIDGWHRIWKAHVLGVKTLPMHLLSQRESKRVRYK